MIEVIKRDGQHILGIGRRLLTLATGPSDDHGIRHDAWLTTDGRRSGWFELHGAGRYLGVYR